MSDFYNKYPYTDFHELNLDWVIERVKKLTEDWLATQEAWNNTQEQWQQLHDYVMDYFANLDVQDEINAKINAMILDGTFLTIVQPTIEQTVIDSATTWLATHITQPTTPAIDTSLSIAGAGADSKQVGDVLAIRFTNIHSAFEVDDIIIHNGNIYRCITPVAANAAFDASDYTQITATKDLIKVLKALTSSDDITGMLADGFINKYDGAFRSDNTYKVTDYIHIVQGDVYEITALINAGDTYACSVAWYDNGKNLVGYNLNTYNNDDFTAPITGYMRLSAYGTDPACEHTGINVLNIANNSAALSQMVADAINDYLVTEHDMVDKCVTGYINKYSHDLTYYNRCITSDYIPVVQNHKYRITCNNANAYSVSIARYDSSKVWTGYDTADYSDAEYIPNFTGYIRLSTYQAGKPQCIDTGLYVNNDIQAINKYSKTVKNLYDFSGKTIIWFGTSIPAGRRTNVVTVDGENYFNDYPSMIGKMLGCNVINQAVGTSTIRTGENSRVSAADPMGIGGIQWEIATLCLTQTSAEKASIISEWATKWGPGGSLALYDAPAALTADDQARITNSSYEVLLTPYLDGTYDMPDLFVIDHGYNDGAYYNSSTGYQMSEIPATPDDRHYFTGACNKIIEMILEANPKAKILLIGHYTKGARSWVADAQEVVSDYWELPLLKLWECSGISDKEILVSGTPTSMIKVYCPDGVHPHSDNTGRSNFHLANIIARFLINT